VNRSIRLRKSCCGTMNMIVLATEEPSGPLLGLIVMSH
jgi:hypothetical protein